MLALSRKNSTGSITGTVKDPKNAVVPGANITLVNAATNNPSTSATNGDGTFVAPTLLPGVYTITVEATGFKKHCGCEI